MALLKKHPGGLLTIFFTEMWERFGFYIMLSVFMLYMNKEFNWSDSYKGYHYGAFLFLVYFIPILGGRLGDKVMGQILTVRLGAILMFFGYIFLALSSPVNLLFFYTGLFLIAFGTGIFKVNMAVLVGNLYQHQPQLKDAGFNIYYMSVNLGALFSPIVATILGNVYGDYRMSFWAAAVGMLIGIITFEFGLNPLKKIDVRLLNIENKGVKQQKAIADNEFGARLFALIALFVIVIFFWMAFYQNGFTLTLFAARSTVISDILRPETYQIFSPLFILLLTPPMVILFRVMRNSGKEPQTPVKILAGMLIMGIAMGVMVAASLAGGNKDENIMSPWWLISTYMVVTVSEILISPMGMSYVSKVAPKRLEGLMMGCWFGATSIGANLSGQLGRFYSDIPHHTFFIILAGFLAFSVALILFVLKKLKKFS